MSSIIRTLSRSGRLIQVLVNCLLVQSLMPRRHRLPSPRCLRLALEKLGSTFIKLGQALALRFDLCPAEYCEEFLSIRNVTVPADFTIIRGIILQELGDLPENIFRTFEPEPFAVTSTGQIHKATAHDGTPLAVKVQNPSLRPQFESDLRLMRWAAWPMDWIGIFGASSVREFVEDFSRSLLDELDFEAALQNAKRMSDLSRQDGIEIGATIRKRYSSRLVLTWEFIEGISVFKILNESDKNGHDKQYDGDKIARRIHWSTLNQIYRDGIFHADLSPAGILVLRGNIIAYVDFAVIGRMPVSLQKSLQFFMQSVLEENFDQAVDEFLLWTKTSNSTDIAAFRQDLRLTLEDYLDGFRSDAGSAPRQTAKYFFINILRVVRKHQVAISTTSLVLYFTTMITLYAIVLELSPHYNPVEDQSRFIARSARLDAVDLFAPAQAMDAIRSSFRQATEIVTNFKRLQDSGQAIELSLRTLQARLLQYVVWVILISAAAYVSLRNRTFESLGLGKYWIPSALLILALGMVFKILSQSRKLAAISRTTALSLDISRRSAGRVR